MNGGNLGSRPRIGTGNPASLDHSDYHSDFLRISRSHVLPLRGRMLELRAIRTY
jgi:hypothetical protein